MSFKRSMLRVLCAFIPSIDKFFSVAGMHCVLPNDLLKSGGVHPRLKGKDYQTYDRQYPCTCAFLERDSRCTDDEEPTKLNIFKKHFCTYI